MSVLIFIFSLFAVRAEDSTGPQNKHIDETSNAVITLEPTEKYRLAENGQ
jgi:hypothetical protein